MWQSYEINLILPRNMCGNVLPYEFFFIKDSTSASTELIVFLGSQVTGAHQKGSNTFDRRRARGWSRNPRVNCSAKMNNSTMSSERKRGRRAS